MSNARELVLLAPSLSALLADAVLVLHASIAVFVVGGLLLVVAGNLARWAWVNKAWFRVAHLAAIGIVVAESWFGLVCPLTTLEMWLRSRAGEPPYGGGFIEHWLQQLLYYSAPPWMFVAAYTLFGLLVLATWWYFPPRFKSRVHERAA
jgi:polyferredoxin